MDSTTSSGDSNDGLDTGDIVAIVSLVIAVIAFFIATAQALQQYLSTADGYRKCAESVMGPWVKHRKRIFRLDELRFGVVFQTPVFFVARPDNERGPIPGKKPLNVDGTSTSRERTLTRAETRYGSEPKKDEDSVSRFSTRVHTANDERASWVTLLEKLQEAAGEADAWDKQNNMTPKGMRYEKPNYTICVQLQGRLRNWDFMPDGVVRPYATTTVCHIAEMATLLGMSWRTFDPDNANLRAEGNGFALSSSSVQGLGTVVTFMVFGRSRFTRNRVIPADEIKALLFGTVPTIFGEQNMIFGDDKGSRRTFLKFLRCKQETFRKYHGVQKHLRSVNFEIIAMLGKCVRIRGSNFKVLPNPTRDPWVDTFNSCTLMVEFKDHVANLKGGSQHSPKTEFILNTWENILKPVWKETEDQIDIDMREAVHNVLDTCTDFLVNKCGQAMVISVVSAHVGVIVDELHEMDSPLSMIDSENEKELVDHYFEKVRPKVVELAAGYETPTKVIRRDTDSMVSREDVWLILQLRMCCWWVLHEFDQTDNSVALEPRWRDSRLPVHIL